ncbi:MAG: valine--tRNA ligase [Candidatus Colwellbacteria bacterium RIFCSPLOWO2_01_FULL_48_10]|uniref:Valine--tRNA ligase n=2 Tax=Bacteria candidate phyla TaxID=1783234 RepID=A0A1G1Z5N2_9BACT|nr:MAG: valine--tRNA ligase [Candidatus Colwellbacteria bacterium RIFCSPLOWO2_01_FULL_48_10]
MDPRYDHKIVEPKIYKAWESSGFFNPDRLPTHYQLQPKNFTIVMPPPNANGRLHAGHALAMTVEDIMVRFRRMQGYKALWIPGADHAGFETQIVYEKKLEKEGRSRFQMKPDELFKEIMAFTLENKKHMEADVRSLGASCDWSREKFTLDTDVVKEVQRTFKKMFDDGLVYRGKRIVNWCIKHQTSLSDVETENVEEISRLYYFKYGPFTIATARPETKFADKYVVMHPDDEKYKAWNHGDKIEVEWINGPIQATVIKDPVIDPAFGTGAMTITPWHSQVDFELAEKYKLDIEQIIDWRGKLLPVANEFADTKISEAREKIVEKLKNKGLLVKVDDKYSHVVKRCYKCNTAIEPQVKDQWFVKMKPLAELAIKTVEDGKIKFIPENYEKIFLYWMRNTTDWNISRQIVWGIKIPAKICVKCGDGFADLENALRACVKCGLTGQVGELKEDTDTFDTWFSSGQWPLLALGYPAGADFKNFYPTNVMETGHDLIFKWIPRMVIFGLYLAKQVPFHTVYLHGLVNDAQGKKMSKSKGNVVSPIELADKYGTDALRMSLVVGNTPGTDLPLLEDKIRGYRNFSTKVWNIARFVLTGYRESSVSPAFTDEDKANDAGLAETKKIVTDYLEAYDLNQASSTIYHYVWHTFADKIIEAYKPRLAATENTADRAAAQATLMNILRGSLKMLHPFMPFVTEEIWSLMPGMKNQLIIEEW